VQEQRADSNDYGMTEELRCLCFYILESDRKFELLGLECKDGGGGGGGGAVYWLAVSGEDGLAIAF